MVDVEGSCYAMDSATRAYFRNTAGSHCLQDCLFRDDRDAQATLVVEAVVTRLLARKKHQHVSYRACGLGIFEDAPV